MGTFSMVDKQRWPISKKLQDIWMSHKINYKGLSKLCEVFSLVHTKNTTCEVVPNFQSFG